MPIPAYLWLKDHAGNPIKGPSDVNGREGSIEILCFIHGLQIPVDERSGRNTGTRTHNAMTLGKEFDCASTNLYRAVCTGQKLQSAELKWYRINNNGLEEEYFNMYLENVRIVSITPVMNHCKEPGTQHINHTEYIDLCYEKITWKYCDGNLSYTDSWNDRLTA